MIQDKFPCEVGPPRKVVTDTKEYLRFINNNNGRKKAIYRSVYSFKDIDENWKPDYNTAIVDCLYFDFDDKSCNSYEECYQLYWHCIENGLKHTIVMSGRGYHFYIFLKIVDLKYPKEAIKRGQQYFINKLKLNVDPQVIGNVAQMARIPNTYHPKAKRFCIPLTQKQFEQGDEFIKKSAVKQNFVNKTAVGKKLFDISEYDIKPDYYNNVNIKNMKSTKTRILNCKDENIPPCIHNLLMKGDCGWRERYHLILFFREKGYLINDIYEILKQYLSEDKFNHCVNEEKQLQYLFGRNDLCFATCDELMEEDLCPGICNLKDVAVYK